MCILCCSRSKKSSKKDEHNKSKNKKPTPQKALVPEAQPLRPGATKTPNNNSDSSGHSSAKKIRRTQ